MSKRVSTLLAVSVLVATGASAQTIVGSDHDLSAALPTTQQVCVFCHTPHQPEGPPQINTDPLWNHTLSTTASYGVYGSSTLDAVPADIGGGSSVSNLCMSCHDGTVGLGSLFNDPNIVAGEETPTNSGTTITGNALMGTDLSNDHPVNFLYDAALATLDGELATPVSADFVDAAAEVPLFAGTVQCASCHDPHDPTNLPFLVKSNTASALCTTCHSK